jgi:DNA polymerase III epsilon subunit-like protein
MSRAFPKENNEISSGTNDTISRTRTGSFCVVNEGNLSCHNTKTSDFIHEEKIAGTTQPMIQPNIRPKKRSRNDCSSQQSSIYNSEDEQHSITTSSAMEESQGNEINVVTLKSVQSSTDNDSTLVRYVAVDVETHDWCKWNSREDYIGRIIQIAWVSYNVQGRVLEKKCHLIKPIGFEISRKAEQYHHITNKMALELGEDATVVLSEFINVLKGISDGGCVIAHNMKHEDCCFARNLTPEQLLIWENVPKVCTMTPRLLRLIHSDHYWSEPGLPRRWGLKLVDLHRLLCDSASGEDSEALRSGAHYALADASMCGQIFFEFKRKVPNETELWWQKDIAVGR